VPYVRTVKTSSGATAVQIVYSSHRGSRQIEHLGSAHDGAGVELLKAAARQRLAAGQGELDLGLAVGAPGGPLPIMSSRMGHLLDGLAHAFGVLGFGGVTGGDEVFAQLVLARIIEPTSKLDAARVLEEAGLEPVSYATLKRRLPAYAKDAWRRKLSAACAEHARLGPASLVLYDVSTLYFETDAGDGFRESGFSKERRLEPQITIGLLTDQGGFPLMVSAFEGNKAETKTMLPVIREFMAAHQLPDVTVVADAGMVSEANQKEIEAAGLSFILGQRVPEVPWVVAEWHREHPGAAVPDGHVFTQRWPAGPNSGRRDKVIYYQYRHDRGRRTLRGIDEQVAKAEKAVAGQVPIKRNRFIQLAGDAHTVNRDLEAKARALAGIKGYVTNLAACPDGTPSHRGLRDRRLPPAVRDREIVPDVQARPAGQAHLPPQAGLHRGPPDRRVRRTRGQPLDRNHHRLVDQEVRPHRPPLPHHRNPGRRAHHHRRRPPARRPQRGPRPHPPRIKCALA
jgi:Transposase DDE domain